MHRGFLVTALLTAPSYLIFARSDYFSPSLRLSGIGVDRGEVTGEVLAGRTERMIESQTFAILRDPRALAGAARVTSPKLQQIFAKAATASGIPASLIAAVSYLESWGEADAESPAGPKGIMQFSEATAREAGLRIVYATRYKTSQSREVVKRKNGKAAFRTVTRRIPYQVKVRDERFIPERAIMAAADYLGRLRDRFGGLDWAIFAYHCGEGCVTEMQGLVSDALGHPAEMPSVAQMFFTASPASHRELYEAIERHMQRDYSPTYWFRIKRAEQLLHLYQTDPDSFKALFNEYRNPANPDRRANDRLAVWLKAEDVLYLSCDDLRRAQGQGLVPALDNPRLFGFETDGMDFAGVAPADRDLYRQASPATIGTLAYIAFETRRLFDAMKVKGQKWAPLHVVELVSTKDGPREAAGRATSMPDLPSHCTGQVFDLDIAGMPPGEREALAFILDELGWDGYLGFIEVSGTTLHVGPSPSSRDFFAKIFQEAASQTAE